MWAGATYRGGAVLASARRIYQKLATAVKHLEIKKFPSRVSTGRGVVALLETHLDGARFRSPEGSV